MIDNGTVNDIIKNVKVGDEVCFYFLDGGNNGGIVTEIKMTKSGNRVLRFDNGNIDNSGSRSRKVIKVTVNEPFNPPQFYYGI